MASRDMLSSPALQAQVGWRGLGMQTYSAAAVSAPLALNASNSNSLVRFDSTVGGVNVTVTLPAVAAAAGCRWRVVKATAGGNVWTFAAPAGTLIAAAIANNAVATGAAATSLAFNAAASAGSWADISCDGVVYQITAVGSAAGSFTIA